MSIDRRVAFSSNEDLRLAIEDLRHSSLGVLIPFILALSWLWFFYNVWHAGLISSNDVPALILMGSVGLSMVMRSKQRHRLASWGLLVGLVIAERFVMAQWPSTIMMAFGVLGIIVADGLLGTGQAALVATAMWWVGITAMNGGELVVDSRAIVMIILYGLTVGTSWLSTRSLQTAVQWALTGWQRANEALTEARDRRGELYRALHALEEATYRIERMNNELIVARNEAEEARAVKAKFVATVSHELRGPLNLVLGFSRLMALSPERYNAPLPADYRADVATIYRSSQHLAKLVDDILDLSQIEAERLALVKERISLEGDVVQAALDIVRPLAERKGLNVQEEVASDLPTILADQVRLRQVMLNLLTNAVRFTERGSITVRAVQEHDQLVVSVQDTGPGIPADEMSRIFREFHQLSTSRGHEDKGSGLGLAISKHLVELHGGEIWVESEVGVGTTFYFSVPLPGKTPLGMGMVQTGEGKHHADSEKGYVLVVHTDPGTVRVLGRHLDGYRVVGVPNPEDSLALTEELHPRAIVTAPELAEQIAQRLSGKPYDVPIVSCQMPQVTGQTPLEGILGYLTKPVTPEMVTATMSQIHKEGETSVLLVDDDPDVLRLVEMMLQAIPHPYRILKARDGVQALAAMQEVVPDIVFMDMIMPGLDGEQTITAMRANERLAQVPVVILSARDWSEEAMTLGAPFSLRCQRAIKLSSGAQCLLAMLEAVAPDYLPQPVFSPMSATGLPL